jgi:hypothetical protein
VSCRTNIGNSDCADECRPNTGRPNIRYRVTAEFIAPAIAAALERKAQYRLKVILLPDITSRYILAL